MCLIYKGCADWRATGIKLEEVSKLLRDLVGNRECDEYYQLDRIRNDLGDIPVGMTVWEIQGWDS